jgi:hypothetical protein
MLLGIGLVLGLLLPAWGSEPIRARLLMREVNAFSSGLSPITLQEVHFFNIRSNFEKGPAFYLSHFGASILRLVTAASQSLLAHRRQALATPYLFTACMRRAPHSARCQAWIRSARAARALKREAGKRRPTSTARRRTCGRPALLAACATRSCTLASEWTLLTACSSLALSPRCLHQGGARSGPCTDACYQLLLSRAVRALPLCS